MQHFWPLNEGAGATANDAVGTNQINLAAPTTPNYTWNTRGIALAAGLIQATLTSSRTVFMVYKTKRASSGGFLISGGPSGSGSGVLQSGGGFSYTLHIGGGYGLHTLSHQANQDAFELNRGGYVMLFQEWGSSYTGAVGFGGRHSTTTSRCDEFELVAAGVYNKALSSDERNTLYTLMRPFVAGKAVYLNWQDCPTRRRAVMLFGESTADGRAKINTLPSGEQTQEFTKAFIQSGNNTTNSITPAVFDLGVNQQTTAPTTDFGPELGFAQSIESGSEDICIVKFAKGSTFLAPTDANGAGNPQTTSNWNAGTVKNAGLVYRGLSHFYDAEQSSRALGIGLNIVGYQFLIGLNDAQATAYTGNSAATYQGYIQAFHDALSTFTGLGGLKVHMPRAHNKDAASNATALSQVRTAQASFITALGSLGTLMDTDSLTLNDGVHFDATSSKAIGAAGHTFLLA